MVSLLAVLAAVGYAAISQGNGPAYLPGYALISLMLVSWMHNRANVREIEISLARSANGFAGGLLLIPFKLRNVGTRPKFGLVIRVAGGGAAKVPRLETMVDGSLSLPVRMRGCFKIEGVTISTVFPLGVFEARKTWPATCEYYVYPEPKGDEPLPGKTGFNTPQKTGKRIAGDDFAGVKNYIVGESQRHVDWKAVARGMPMMIKQFETITREEFWLEWDFLPALEVEGRLSQLAQWIVASERAGNRYGLRLPGTRIEPGQGDSHYHRCLRSLAVFGEGKKP